MGKAFAGFALVGLLFAFWFGVGPDNAGAAGCPNEALRIGPSALLPECRAYEQVTPVDKEGGTGIFLNGVVQAAPSGEGVSFVSASAYGEPQGSALINRYVATRGAADWLTKPADGPQAIQELLLVRATLAVSENLEYTLTASKEAFAPGAIPDGSNLYLRNTVTGASTLIAAKPGNRFFFEITGTGGATFVGASSDWSRLLLFSREALAPGAEAGQPNLYEFAGGTLTLAAPSGDLPAAQTSTAQSPYVMSTDGNRFFFTENGVLKMREGQARTIPISESQVIPKGRQGHLAEGTFAGATPDGSAVFFTSGGNLTGDSSGTALYRYEVGAPAGRHLTDLTPDSINRSGGPAVSTVAAIGENGEYVYFLSTAQLAAAAPAAEGFSTDIYVWHGGRGEAGTVRYIAQTEPQDFADPPQARASADGRFFAIGARSPLTPAAAEPSPACEGSPTEGVPPERCLNVFAYSYEGDSLLCVTCTGKPSLGDSAVGGQNSREEVFTYVPRAVLDDGTFYFDTPEALVPRDTNGVGDVYEWRAGRFELLSTGTGDTASTFGDATADGRNVFIRSSQQLVGQDVDSAQDVYDVRVEGGLAGQAGSSSATPCFDEASCRNGLKGAPPAPPAASSAVEGEEDVRGRCIATRRQAAASRRRAAALGRRAKVASGSRARALHRQASRLRKKGNRLARASHTCTKGASR